MNDDREFVINLRPLRLAILIVVAFIGGIWSYEASAAERVCCTFDDRHCFITTNPWCPAGTVPR